MAAPIRLILALHNHQPVGNFDDVYQQAVQDSYGPFLDLLERFPTVPVALHTSGSLMEWLLEHQPGYVDRLAGLVATGRVEVIGGPFYEPILSMLPSPDRIGQIVSYTELLQRRLDTRIRGMWMPERVWEPGLVADLVTAGMEFTLLDDFHFKNAGLDRSQLISGYYVTEDQGELLKVFPIDEPLRYLIPFDTVEATAGYLHQMSQDHPGCVLVFGDDGEKFGVWPGTKKHVYDDGWLERFFEAITAGVQQGWLQLTTFGEVIDHLPPAGKIYLPGSSYREMTEWALPVQRQIEFDELKGHLKDDERWPSISQFIRGSIWRNFKVKYPETDEMYARMMMVSRRLQSLQGQGGEGHAHPGQAELLQEARRELYRGQCNCAYWHGAFGGIYLPHLRQAIYKHLIQADTFIERAERPSEAWVDVSSGDYNLDARQETMAASDRLVALFAPAAGGMLYELDVRAIGLNLLSTMARRPEAYHRAVLGGENGNLAAVSTEVIFKHPDLDQKVFYDHLPRKSLIDHFYDLETTHAQVAQNKAHELGDFAAGNYEARIRRSTSKVQIQLSRQGTVGEIPVGLSKTVTVQAGSSVLLIDYELEGLPAEAVLHFAPEFNFAGLPGGADDRYFHDGQDNQLGRLGSFQDLQEAYRLHMTDQWLGIDVGLTLSQPAGLWAFPIESVSQSEGGFEGVHQQVCVIPHWLVRGDAQGRWSVRIELNLDTSLAESRQRGEVSAVAAS